MASYTVIWQLATFSSMINTILSRLEIFVSPRQTSIKLSLELAIPVMPLRLLFSISDLRGHINTILSVVVTLDLLFSLIAFIHHKGSKKWLKWKTHKVIDDFGTNRKRVCVFLLVRHSKLGPILYRFGDIAGFCAHDTTPTSPYFWVFFSLSFLPLDAMQSPPEKFKRR